MFTVLIVEDSRFFRQSLKQALLGRFPNIRVEEAADGVRAMEMLAAGVPDLTFVDIRLPGENGLELTRKMKHRHRRMPVIVITNYDIPEYREAAFRNGADFFVPKGSWTWNEITGLVEALLLKDSRRTDARRLEAAHD